VPKQKYFEQLAEEWQ